MSRAFKRLDRQYRTIRNRRADTLRTKIHAMFAGRTNRPASLEPLEPRLLLDAAGPRIISHTPEGSDGSVSSLTVTFDRPIDPATFTAEDAMIVMDRPAVLGSYWEMLKSAGGLAIVDNMAYVTYRQGYLKIFNISNPASPALVGSCHCSGYSTTYGVAVSGGVAYVANGPSGLDIIDVSNPSAPVRITNINLSTSSYTDGVAVVGNTIYVAYGTRGLQIFDVSNPALPVRLGGYDTLGDAYSVTIQGNLAYVADGSAGLTIVDVSTPATPVLLGSYDTLGESISVTVAGNVAYVADNTNGLEIIGVSIPSVPTHLSNYPMDGAISVSLSGSLAYVERASLLGAYGNGLSIIDVRNPTTPVGIVNTYHGYSNGGIYRTVIATERLAYLTEGEGGFIILETQKEISSITTIDATTYRIDLPGNLPSGVYNVLVGPNIAAPAGHLMDQNADGIGGDTAGDTYRFHFTTPSTTVVGRYIFYNNRSLDGKTPSDWYKDDANIATDKVALLPGGTAGPDNHTAFSKGINGVMMDIRGFALARSIGMFGTLPISDDFIFRVGNSASPAEWVTAPAPTTNFVRRVSSSTITDPTAQVYRVSFVWPDGAIAGKWLEVTALSDTHGGHLGLGEDDVFYFGNLPGDADGNDVVDMADYSAWYTHNAESAGVSEGDFDGNNLVDMRDYAVWYNSNIAGLAALNLSGSAAVGSTEKWVQARQTAPSQSPFFALAAGALPPTEEQATLAMSADVSPVEDEEESDLADLECLSVLDSAALSSLDVAVETAPVAETALPTTSASIVQWNTPAPSSELSLDDEPLDVLALAGPI